MQKRMNTTKVRAKLISEETLREKRKRYFGILILVKIAELESSEVIPPLDASLKNEKTILPQKR